MIDDRPVSMNRAIAIEATMDEMKSQHKATHQMLQDVLTRLGPVPTQDVQDPLPTHSARHSPAPSMYTRLFRWSEEGFSQTFLPPWI